MNEKRRKRTRALSGNAKLIATVVCYYVSVFHLILKRMVVSFPLAI